MPQSVGASEVKFKFKVRSEVFRGVEGSVVFQSVGCKDLYLTGLFFDEFSPDDGDVVPEFDDSSPDSWIAAVGGRSFGGGMYRVHTPESGVVADSWVASAFPAYEGRVACYGYDWLGRQFAIDTQRGAAEGSFMVEIGFAEVLWNPVSFDQMHGRDMADIANEIFAGDFLASWRKAGGKVPGLSECVGYRKPPFLGGADELDNLQLTDLETYWTIMGELCRKVADLPEGTQISGITLEPLQNEEDR